MTRSDHLETMAAKHYARHELVDSAESRWLIRRPDVGLFWAEIAVLREHLVIVGHGPAMIVQSPSGCCPRGTLEWAASSTLGCLTPKVVAGKAKTWSLDLAKEELLACLLEIRKKRRGEDDAEVAAWEEAVDLTSVQDVDSVDIFWASLAWAGIDAPHKYGFGDTYSAHIYSARAAIRRLAELLKGEDL